MDITTRDQFIEKWNSYFPEAELPLTFFYSKQLNGAEKASKPSGHRCMICDLNKARKGISLAFNRENIGCGGGLRYTGYEDKVRDDFEFFLSCGKEGLEGERYKKDPETVREMMDDIPLIPAKNQWLIFKRWDQLNEEDEPEVAVFFAKPDILAGLFMLANYDFIGQHGVITPFSSGCGASILYPYFEMGRDKPKSVLGMFDPSARPCVEKDVLTFSTPVKRLIQMMHNMDESFLITKTWGNMKKRLEK